ncbi:MAG: hypothetical protein RMZ42_21495 [Nostoc sp. DedQUE05]|uniref:hypothetical protein n=1 Tax=Nostoc sp. DedQUE05 TaxID=3075391 RepID=UPI002AD487EC|nr:hypothetical protein [Nostoc sp. DedQUE05]MDZ8094480.1 hypothetical protein [Nostoc sp. DedQUE05]
MTTKNVDKYADVAPKSKEEIKPIAKENSQIHIIVTLLTKGATLNEFDNREKEYRNRTGRIASILR